MGKLVPLGILTTKPLTSISGGSSLSMVLIRLQSFQNSEYKCKENEMTINKLEEALMWLNKRTQDRISRNVEGTNLL